MHCDKLIRPLASLKYLFPHQIFRKHHFIPHDTCTTVSLMFQKDERKQYGEKWHSKHVFHKLHNGILKQ